MPVATFPFVPIDAVNVRTKFEVRTFTRSEIIAIGVLGALQSRERGHRWTGMVSFIFTRFRDIAAFVLQHTTFPTPPLVSPKFPHVPLGVGCIRNPASVRSFTV